MPRQPKDSAHRRSGRAGRDIHHVDNALESRDYSTLGSSTIPLSDYCGDLAINWPAPEWKGEYVVRTEKTEWGEAPIIIIVAAKYYLDPDTRWGWVVVVLDVHLHREHVILLLFTGARMTCTLVGRARRSSLVLKTLPVNSLWFRNISNDMDNCPEQVRLSKSNTDCPPLHWVDNPVFSSFSWYFNAFQLYGENGAYIVWVILEKMSAVASKLAKCRWRHFSGSHWLIPGWCAVSLLKY